MKTKPFHLSVIEISTIDAEDFSFEFPNLKSESITTHSDLFVYNPIYLQAKQNGKYRIIDGFLSYRNAIQRKDATISAFVFNGNMTEFDLWIFRLNKRVAEQNFSLISIIEKVRDLIEQTQMDIHINHQLNAFLKKLRISPHLKIERMFDDIMKRKELIASFTNPASLSFKELAQLSKIKPEVLSQLSQLLGGLGLKGNKLTSCLKVIEELQNGFGISITNILKDDQIQNILENSPDHLKYKAIKQRLTELRFPKLNQLQSIWDRNIRHLKLDPEISVNVDPYFEDDFLKIEIQANSTQHLKKHLDDLSDKVSNEKFNDLFDLI